MSRLGYVCMYNIYMYNIYVLYHVADDKYVFVIDNKEFSSM